VLSAECAVLRQRAFGHPSDRLFRTPHSNFRI
jgi:hypothetical protein